MARAITAYDKDTGAYVGSVALPEPPWGNPVTYLDDGTQYIVVATGSASRGSTPSLIALALP